MQPSLVSRKPWKDSDPACRYDTQYQARSSHEHETIMLSNPPKCREPFRTKLGANVSNRSRRTSRSTSPTLVATVFGFDLHIVLNWLATGAFVVPQMITQPNLEPAFQPDHNQLLNQSVQAIDPPSIYVKYSIESPLREKDIETDPFDH